MSLRQENGLGSKSVGGRPVDIGAFYSANPAATWQRVLGEGMHYHFGLFADTRRPVDDGAMDAALEEAVRVFYPHIRDGASVLDVGCGWGGTLRMLAAEKLCSATGLTNSRAQFDWCRSCGLSVELADAEDPSGLPKGPFDVAIMIESLCHIRDKGRLLERLADVASRLVLRANCNQLAVQDASQSGSMTLMPRGCLMALIERSGWRVVSAVDRRAASMPTFDGWSLRLDRLDPVEVNEQLRVLDGLCAHARFWGAAWATSNPLMDIIAESVRPAWTS